MVCSVNTYLYVTPINKDFTLMCPSMGFNNNFPVLNALILMCVKLILNENRIQKINDNHNI